MNDDFSHARAAVATTRTISSAQQSLLRLVGNDNDASSAAPTPAAALTINSLTTVAVLPGRNTPKHASALAIVAAETTTSSAAGAGAGAEVDTCSIIPKPPNWSTMSKM